jgi:hypothetical protein
MFFVHLAKYLNSYIHWGPPPFIVFGRICASDLYIYIYIKVRHTIVVFTWFINGHMGIVGILTKFNIFFGVPKYCNTYIILVHASKPTSQIFPIFHFLENISPHVCLLATLLIVCAKLSPIKLKFVWEGLPLVIVIILQN